NSNSGSLQQSGLGCMELHPAETRWLFYRSRIHRRGAMMFDQSGFTILRGVFSIDEAAKMISGMETGLMNSPSAARSSRGAVYAARNVLEFWPPAKVIWRRSAIVSFLSEVLGDSFGLVRGLYFDKPPERTWSLPWHQDLTVAVKEHHTADGFS